MIHRRSSMLSVLSILFIAVSLVSCGSPVQGSGITATETKFIPSTLVPAATLAVTVPPAQPTLIVVPKQPAYWFDPGLPAGFQKSFRAPAGWQTASSPEKAAYLLTISSQNVISRWTYALVAPFPTVTDQVASDLLKEFWQGSPANLPAEALMVDSSTFQVFSDLWGEPGIFVKKVPSNEMLKRAWETETDWAIIPFEELQPRWKVIAVDNQSPIQKSFDPQKYPLIAPISLLTHDAVLPDTAVVSRLAPAGNRLPDQLTTVILTGVTALVRGTAALMEIKGLDYPGLDIRATLREADITHISNEIPYTPRCPAPYPRVDSLVFCSRPKYNQLLEDIGAKIVELDGDHFQDWGSEAVLFTIDYYKQHGMQYYGGGVNLDDARKPLLIEKNGNKIAFLGCNGKLPGYATAAATRPGAVHCNYPWLANEIKQLRDRGYIPIVTMQHEEYYTYEANPNVKPDFQGLSDAGAEIVTGVQAHQPQALEFRGNNLIHYGLGNLFFDQFYEGKPSRQAFMDRHVIYDGKYINTELLTIKFVDNARPRLMNSNERQDLLKTIFKASGW